MDQLIKRGISHIIKQIPSVKPADLTKIQSEYYDFLSTGKFPNGDFESIVRDSKDYMISDDDHLWLALIFRSMAVIKKYLSAEKRDAVKFAEICKGSDIFHFMGILKTLDLMQERQKEQDYFKLVRGYYKDIINATMVNDPISFFVVDPKGLKFIREVLELDVAQFELSPLAFEIYKSKEYYLVGIPEDLQTKEFTYSKLLEMSAAPEEYYNRLRKHTETFLNGLGYNFANTVDESGKEIVDYPWFKLKMRADNEGKVHVSPLEGTKSFADIYKMKFEYKIVEEGGEKFVKVDNYPLVQMTENKGPIKPASKKFLEHFHIQ